MVPGWVGVARGRKQHITIIITIIVIAIVINSIISIIIIIMVPGMGGSGTRQEATQASCGTAANSDPWVPFASILWALTSGQGIWGVLEACSSVFSKLWWVHFARLVMPAIAYYGFSS